MCVLGFDMCVLGVHDIWSWIIEWNKLSSGVRFYYFHQTHRGIKINYQIHRESVHYSH